MSASEIIRIMKEWKSLSRVRKTLHSLQIIKINILLFNF
jgi:hypothetical protein